VTVLTVRYVGRVAVIGVNKIVGDVEEFVKEIWKIREK
jgi:hypothetical protein